MTPEFAYFLKVNVAFILPQIRNYAPNMIQKRK